MTTLFALQSDIIQPNIDAIVNAANPPLQVG